MARLTAGQTQDVDTADDNAATQLDYETIDFCRSVATARAQCGGEIGATPIAFSLGH